MLRHNTQTVKTRIHILDLLTLRARFNKDRMTAFYRATGLTPYMLMLEYNKSGYNGLTERVDNALPIEYHSMFEPKAADFIVDYGKLDFETVQRMEVLASPKAGEVNLADVSVTPQTFHYDDVRELMEKAMKLIREAFEAKVPNNKREYTAAEATGRLREIITNKSAFKQRFNPNK